jgi:D-arabinose 1-dehydrogenase-like Zn-dependent alcohol dehydrogenase
MKMGFADLVERSDFLNCFVTFELDIAGVGKVKATVEARKLEDINAIFHQMHQGKIEGRIVLDLSA